MMIPSHDEMIRWLNELKEFMVDATEEDAEMIDAIQEEIWRLKGLEY